MKSLSFLHLRFFFFAGVILAFVTMHIDFSVMKVEAASKQSEITLKVDQLVDDYHDKMNQLFNKYIAVMVNEKDSKKLLALVESPKKVEGIRNCKTSKSNYSIYCLSLISANEYFTFREKMLSAREEAKTVTTGRIQDIKTYGEIVERVDLEIDVARQTLDQTLATYQELQMALPMHRKFQDIIKALEKYRNKVSSMRKSIEQYPATFLDVTTPACT